MMIRIFSSKYIVAVLATMAMTSNNSNGGVHAAATLASDLKDAGKNAQQAVQNTWDASYEAGNAIGDQVNANIDYIFGKDSNETDIPDDVDVGVPNEKGETKTDTGPDDGQEVAGETVTDKGPDDMENVAAPSAVSSASLLTSSMVGIAAVTTAFVAIA